MDIQRLDHVNIRTGQLNEMMSWYGEVLGLYPGDRPDFSFGGAWLYAEKAVVIHLIDIGEEAAVGGEANLKLEHFSLAATDIESFESELEASNTPYQRIVLASIGEIQLHMRDPDGNHLHIDFSTSG